MILNPVFVDITTLKGVGPKVAALIGKISGPRIVDLIFTPPKSLIDRSKRPLINEAEQGDLVTLEVTVDQHQPPPKGMSRLPYKVLCSDRSGFITLIFFHARPDYLMRHLPEGESVLVSGKVERYSGGLQMPHPDYMVPASTPQDMPLYEPVYPLTAGLSGKVMRKAVHEAVKHVPALPEWQRADILRQKHWPDFRKAIEQLHHPQSNLDMLPEAAARQRLAYDELLANQLALQLIRSSRKREHGRSLSGSGELRATILRQLPYQLTTAQNHAIKEIFSDMAAPTKMIRLLQGDVGSGKTIVALMAMLAAVESGAQAVLMAPTEILARQHFDTIAPLLEASSISCELLTGRDRGVERTAKLTGVSKGYINILIGTHAVFSQDVHYQNLGLVIVDEQHRFGVLQRMALQDKGQNADLLVMTATPIPRTLALTTYGDMDISQLQEKPPGRQPVDTRAVPMARLDEVTNAIARVLDKDEQVYWVCPLVEENDQLALTSAEMRYQELYKQFGDKIGLVHGKMKPAEKDAVIEAFFRGEIKLLIATTVIEVGVNAPNATIIVIEHAERFGLAQLHQLRGRVGRGDRPASCLLLYQPNDKGSLSDTAKARLNILRETEDGFLIAEEDLRLRGAGDLLGAEQSGLPQFRLADIAGHGKLLEMARDDARLFLQEDPHLKSERGRALLILLYLFVRDDAVKLLTAG